MEKLINLFIHGQFYSSREQNLKKVTSETFSIYVNIE